MKIKMLELILTFLAFVIKIKIKSEEQNGR
jgi:hypothetical protein